MCRRLLCRAAETAHRRGSHVLKSRGSKLKPEANTINTALMTYISSLAILPWTIFLPEELDRNLFSTIDNRNNQQETQPVSNFGHWTWEHWFFLISGFQPDPVSCGVSFMKCTPTLGRSVHFFQCTSHSNHCFKSLFYWRGRCKMVVSKTSAFLPQRYSKQTKKLKSPLEQNESNVAFLWQMTEKATSLLRYLLKVLCILQKQITPFSFHQWYQTSLTYQVYRAIQRQPSIGLNLAKPRRVIWAQTSIKQPSYRIAKLSPMKALLQLMVTFVPWC